VVEFQWLPFLINGQNYFLLRAHDAAGLRQRYGTVMELLVSAVENSIPTEAKVRAHRIHMTYGLQDDCSKSVFSYNYCYSTTGLLKIRTTGRTDLVRGFLLGVDAGSRIAQGRLRFHDGPGFDWISESREILQVDASVRCALRLTRETHIHAEHDGSPTAVELVLHVMSWYWMLKSGRRGFWRQPRLIAASHRARLRHPVLVQPRTLSPAQRLTQRF
jgi:hypothetical protein